MTSPPAVEPSIVVDRGLAIVGLDDARLADLLGRRPVEVRGQPLAALLHPDDGRLAASLLRGRPAVEICSRWRWRSTSSELRTLVVWWRATEAGWAGVLGGGDKLLTVHGDGATVAPSTERAARLARLGTFEHDIEHGSTTWSRVMYELHELDPGQSPPGSLHEYLRFLHPDDADPWVRALHQALTSPDVVSLVSRIRRADRSYRSVKVTLCCDRRADDSPARVSGTMQDVTDEVEARTVLVRDRERALADTRAKGEFLARVTHELRTPVAGVIGMIDLAIEDAVPAQRDAHLASARASARHLLELIDDLLDASREDAWRFNIVEIVFDLDEVMAQALAMVAPRAQRKGLTLTGTVAPGLAVQRVGDPLRLRQILINLLYNAVKFTERGTVRARLDAGGDDDQVQLTVEDSGVGIGPEVQAAVFEPYVRGNLGEGFGLGLAITRELVTALGGRISFTSTPGVGTCFTAVLPLRVHASERGPAVARSPAVTDAPRPAPPRRVLVVEDHPVNAAYLQAILARAGHVVAVVGTGQAAVAAAARGEHDVALMDLELPDTDGASAVRAVRAAERAASARRMPVLGVSAHRDRALHAAGAGMDGYLIKPVDPAQLAAEIDRVTGDRWRPPIDHAIRVARVGGRRELAATIVQTFLGHAAGLIGPVDAALAAGSDEGVRRAAHGLRAALLMVGAVPAAELAAELEQASLDEAGGLRDRLAFELARVTAELEQS